MGYTNNTIVYLQILIFCNANQQLKVRSTCKIKGGEGPKELSTSLLTASLNWLAQRYT